MNISEAFEPKKGLKISRQTKQILIFAAILFFLFLVLFLLLSGGKQDKNTLVIEPPQAENITTPPPLDEMYDTAAIAQVQGQAEIEVQNNLGESVKSSLDEKKSVALIEEQEQVEINSRNEEMKKFLNSIKNEITLIDGNKFLYQKKSYVVGDFILDIQVIDIDKDYIRFSGESWSYVLRFF